MLSAKEIKAFLEIGTAMGLTGADLRQYVDDAQKTAVIEREKATAFEIEKAKIEAEKQAREIEKAKLEADEKARMAQIEFERTEKEKAFELERAEKEKAFELEKAEKEKAFELEKAKFEADEKARLAQIASNQELEKAKIEAEKVAQEFERAKFEADVREKEKEQEQERELTRLRYEHEARMRELEIRETTGQDGTRSRHESGSSNNSGFTGLKALKLPVFVEDKDDLDAYLLRFERACEAYHVRDNDRVMQLARLLQGKALDVYNRLSDSELQSYESLKDQLLKRFRLTEGGYRKKFRESKLEVGETPSQFANRLKHYLARWLEMSGLEATYEGLESLIVRDQYFFTCGKELQLFLKEQGKLNLDEMTTKASHYLEAHGYQKANWESHKGRDDRNGSRTANTGNDKNVMRCDICHRTNHKTADHRENPTKQINVGTTNHNSGGTNRTSGTTNKGLTCYNCGKAGHRAYQCSEPKSGQPRLAGAMQVIQESTVTSITQNEPVTHKCNNNNTNGEVKLCCGCTIPVVAGAWSDRGRKELEKLRTTLNPCCKGTINGITTDILRDTGCSTVVVKSNLVKSEQMTGETELCVLIDGAAKRFPTAMVELDTPYYTGTTKALCMESPIQDVIIGNIPGARDPRSFETSEPVEQNTNKIASSTESHINKHMCRELNDVRPMSIGNDVTKNVNNNSLTTTLNEQVLNESEETTILTVETTVNGIGGATGVMHSCNEVSQNVNAEQFVKLDDKQIGGAVETRAMAEKASRPKHALKVPEVDGIDINVDTLKELQAKDETLKKCWELSKLPLRDDAKSGFVVRNNILYRAYRDGHDRDRRYQLVVPKELREKVLTLAHETLLSGHRGTAKTISRVSQDFYYPGVYDDCRRHCMSCDVCQRSVHKGSVGKAPLGKLPLIGVPFSMVCIDIIGPLSPPSDGNRYILTIIDQCTRFPEAIPLRDIETSTVAEALMSTFSRVGLPNRIHSDCGSNLTSAMMKEVYRLMSISPSTTAPWHPMGNGIIENFNKTIKNLLKKVAVERPKDWSRYLAPLMFAVRDTPQDSTGFSPFELLYGRTVRTPMTLLKELWTGEVEEPELKTTYQYVIDLRERIEETCALAKEELSKVQTRNQKYYNRKTRNRQLKVGDYVLLLLPTEHNKLLLAWQGPFPVVAKVGEVDYRVEVAPGKVKTYHVNLLKRYYHRNGLQQMTTKEQADTVTVTGTDDSQVHTIGAVACVLEDIEVDGDSSMINDADSIPLYNVTQKETIDDVMINPSLTDAQKSDIRSLLEEYREIFTDIPSETHLTEHKVVLTQKEPVRCKAYPIPYHLESVMSKELDDMLAMGIIERSDAAYASPIVLVKKSDNTYRMCINFKELNKITVFDPELMMSPDDIFPKLSGSKFYSTFDFCKGYWAIPMEESSKDCTSFITPRGLMRFRVMPFGMVNAGSTYNRMVRKLLEGSQNLESYVDDIIGYSQNWAYHLQILRDFCERVRRATLSLKPSKCKIGYDTVDFLGHTLKTDFISPQSETVGRVLKMSPPKTKKQVRSLIGLVNFYRRYIPDCATLLSPISDLTKGKGPNQVEWGESQERAFVKLKDILSSEPILKLPDLQKDFILQTDASNFGIGACLFQDHDGRKHPVMYASRKLLDREKNYSVGEREALAIKWGVEKFHRFLYGRHFTLESDHRPLQYLNSSDSQSPRLMRWSLALQPYRYTVKYIRGEDNFCADCLSRCVE